MTACSILVCSIAALSLACGSIETDFQPWYNSYILNRVDLKEYFPRDYQSQPMVIKTLSANQNRYTVLYQNRQPESPPFALIMDKDLNVLTSFSDSRMQDPDGWYAAPDGTLRLGYLTLTPPPGSTGTWTRTLNSDIGVNVFTDTRLTWGNRAYDMHFAVSSTGDLILPFTTIPANTSTNQPQQNAVTVYDSTFSQIGIVSPDKVLVSDFLNDYRTRLFPLIPASDALGMYSVAIKSVSFSDDQRELRFAAQLKLQDGSPIVPQNGRESMYFILRLTLPSSAPDLDTLATNMNDSTSVRVMNESLYFDVAKMASYGGNVKTVVTRDALLSFYNSGVPLSGGETAPYATALTLDSDTPLAFKLPQIKYNDGDPALPNPQFQAGSDLWFVWDARTCTLFRNVAWWEAQ